METSSRHMTRRGMVLGERRAWISSGSPNKRAMLGRGRSRSASSAADTATTSEASRWHQEEGLGIDRGSARGANSNRLVLSGYGSCLALIDECGSTVEVVKGEVVVTGLDGRPIGRRKIENAAELPDASPQRRMKSRRLTRGSPGELVDLDFVLDCVVKIITIFTGHLSHFAPNTFSVISSISRSALV